MCGFVVWFNKNNQVDSRLLEEAINLQAHRGPDNSSIKYVGPNYRFISEKAKKKRIGFAHNRLSIIDLSKNSSISNTTYIHTKSITITKSIYSLF